MTTGLPEQDLFMAPNELELLSDFFEHASLGLHILSSDGMILRANHADYELLGYSADEYVGHNIAEFHADPEVLDDILTRLGRGEVLKDYPARLLSRDGEIRHVLIDSSAHFQEGSFVHARCLTRDVTDQRRLERMRALEEESARLLVRALPALIVTLTPEGEMEEISESYAQYTGLTLEQAKNWEVHQVIHADDYAHAMAVWGHALSTGEPMHNEMRLRRHDGVYRWYIVEGTPIRDEDGRVVRWVTVNIDIEDRKRAEMHERYLAETTARLVAPLESTELLSEIARLAVPMLADICSIGVFDASAQTVRIETAGQDEREGPLVARIHLRGWRSAPGSGRTIGEVVGEGTPVYVADFSPSWIDACAPDVEQRDIARAIAARSLVCVPLTARGRAIGIATFATTRSHRVYTERDVAVLQEVATRLGITIENVRLFRELETTADELRRANAAKDEFLGLVSHELKTPLTTVRGNAEVLVRSGSRLDAETRQAALNDIVNESVRLERIIENLLFLARAEHGQLAEREPMLVIRVVEAVVRRHQRRFPTRKIEIVEQTTPPRPVWFPSGYLELVIDNLLTNAEKYSPSDAQVEVHIERVEHEVRVSVLDRGRGIPEADAARLFEPFFRSKDAAAQATGIGVGLAVCKRLVQSQGGEMWARNRPDGGADIGFRLPVVENTPAATDSAPSV